MIRPLLGTTHHAGVESRVASGLPLYELMEQIRVELRRSVGEEHALLFAEPNANAGTGEIQWYASKEGVARPLSELAGEERRAAEVHLARLTTDIEAHTATLSRSASAQDQQIAKVLGDALEIPREEDIFVVNGQPVIAAWGHVLRGPGARRQILAALAERVKPLPPPPPQSPSKPDVADTWAEGDAARTTSEARDTDVTRPVVPPSETKPDTEERRRRRRWLLWLFWLLLLLLLLLLALWAWDRYCCLPREPLEPETGKSGEPTTPGKPAPDASTPGAPAPGAPIEGTPPPVTNPPRGTLACSAGTSSGGGLRTLNRHYLGDKPGRVTIAYDMDRVPDEIRIYYRGRLVASTQGSVSGRGTLSFNYQPEDNIYTVEVEVVGSTGRTTWDYTVGCPQ